MGGPGSGEWSRGVKAPTLEDLRSLDIRLLRAAWAAAARPEHLGV